MKEVFLFDLDFVKDVLCMFAIYGSAIFYADRSFYVVKVSKDSIYEEEKYDFSVDE
jgi:hypothetical protein